MNKEDDGLDPLDEEPTEEGQDLELDDPKSPESQEDKGKSNDPLDEIADLEELRNKAKGYRSAAQRKSKEVEKPTEEEKPKEEPKGDYMSRSEFQGSNQKKAITMATRIEETDSDEVKAQKAYVTENWDGIRQLYVSRKGKDTPEDIFDDIKDAVTLYTAKNPPKEGESGTEDLHTTPGVGTGGGKPQPVGAKPPPNFRLPTKPEDWYSKPPGKE